MDARPLIAGALAALTGFACARESDCQKGRPAILVELDFPTSIAAALSAVEISATFDGIVRRMEFPISSSPTNGVLTLAIGLDSVVTHPGTLTVAARLLDGSGNELESQSLPTDVTLDACNRVTLPLGTEVGPTDGGTTDASKTDTGTPDTGTCSVAERCCAGTCNLVGYWPLDEGTTATIARDVSGHHLDGILKNGPVFQPSGGIHGGALVFNGVNSYVDLGNPPALQFRGSLTVSAWAKLDPTADMVCDQAFVSKRGLANRGWQLYGQGTAPYDATFDVARDMRNYAKVVGPTLLESQWTHLVGVYRASMRAMVLFVDGVPTSSATVDIPAQQYDPALAVRLGAQAQGSCYYKGALDEVRIYDGALTDEEARALP